MRIPRVTKPYTEGEWTAINLLGRAIDDDLTAGDVRLSMGGEPTFVSIDDMESPEWNIAADGRHKRKLAGDLVKRLSDAFRLRRRPPLRAGKMVPGGTAAPLGPGLLLAEGRPAGVAGRGAHGRRNPGLRTHPRGCFQVYPASDSGAGCGSGVHHARVRGCFLSSLERGQPSRSTWTP